MSRKKLSLSKVSIKLKGYSSHLHNAHYLSCWYSYWVIIGIGKWIASPELCARQAHRARHDYEIAWLQGIVQRDLTRVKTRLKWSVLINCLVANNYVSFLKGYHSEKVKNRFQLNWTFRLSSHNPANDSFHTVNLEISLAPADDLAVQHLYGTIISGQLILNNVQYSSAPYNHSTVQVRFCTIISWRRQDYIQILAWAHILYHKVCSS
jgi:hypothetical protein